MYALLGFIFGLFIVLTFEGLVIYEIVVIPRRRDLPKSRPKPEQLNKSVDATHDLRALHNGLQRETCYWFDAALGKAWCSLRDSDAWKGWLRSKLERKLRDIQKKPMGIFLDNFKLVDVTYGNTPPMLNEFIVIPNAKDKVVTMVGEVNFTGKLSLSVTCDLPMRVPISARIVVHEISGRVVIEFKRTQFSIFSYGFLDDPNIHVECTASLGGWNLPFLARFIEKVTIRSITKKATLPKMKTKWLIRPKEAIPVLSPLQTTNLPVNFDASPASLSGQTGKITLEMTATAESKEEKNAMTLETKERRKIERYLSLSARRKSSPDSLDADRSEVSSRKTSPDRSYSSFHFFKPLGNAKLPCDVCFLTTKDLSKCKACGFIAHTKCSSAAPICAVVSAKQHLSAEKKRLKEEKKAKKAENKGYRSISVAQGISKHQIIITPSHLNESKSQILSGHSDGDDDFNDNDDSMVKSQSTDLWRVHGTTMGEEEEEDYIGTIMTENKKEADNRPLGKPE